MIGMFFHAAGGICPPNRVRQGDKTAQVLSFLLIQEAIGMLDRRAILDKLRAVGWDADGYWLITGAAMVLHGAKESTRDIDMGVTPRFADQLIRRGARAEFLPDGGRKIVYDDEIELFENWREGEIVRIDGVPTLALEGIVAMKEKLGREKDWADIARIREFKARCTAVYFVRHAQANYQNHVDRARELTEKGMADRALVTEFLSDKGISCVYSSPYCRAIDTVAPLAQRRGLAVTPVEDFRERSVDDAWIDDFDSFARRQWADFNFKREGGESLSEVQARNIAALNAVVRAHPGEAVAIGSHGTALSTVIHFFNPSFGYAEFEKIRPVMPWIAKFTFEGEKFAYMEEIDLFLWKEQRA